MCLDSPQARSAYEARTSAAGAFGLMARTASLKNGDSSGTHGSKTFICKVCGFRSMVPTALPTGQGLGGDKSQNLPYGSEFF